MIIQQFWNWDVSQAPKSTTKKVLRRIKGEMREIDQTVSVWIIAAYPGSLKAVAKTRWLPDENRWEGFTCAQEPVAWMLWPEYPTIEDESAVFG